MIWTAVENITFYGWINAQELKSKKICQLTYHYNWPVSTTIQSVGLWYKLHVCCANMLYIKQCICIILSIVDYSLKKLFFYLFNWAGKKITKTFHTVKVLTSLKTVQCYWTIAITGEACEMDMTWPYMKMSYTWDSNNYFWKHSSNLLKATKRVSIDQVSFLHIIIQNLSIWTLILNKRFVLFSN